MKILGLSCFYHDSAACLLDDGDIVAAAQEERFTRVKHDFNFPAEAVKYCLREAKIDISDIDYVAFYDKPFIKFERILETYLGFVPKGINSYIKAMPLWIRQKLWIPDIIEKETGFTGEVLFPEHHESHAAAAFFPSPFQRAAFLTVDGVGEWATSSWGVGRDNRVTLKAELHFPHSIGLLYSAFTYFTGFKVNSGEYKIMGLAPYGEPKYVQRIFDHLIDLKEDGSFRMDMDYFNYCAGLTMTNRKFADLFDGPPRKSETNLTQREMDLARSVQDVTEEIVYRMARHVKKETGEKNLCLAGGVALNCVANGKLLRSGLFDDIWIQPAAGDAGGALGAAYIVHHHVLGNPLPDKKGEDLQKGSYLGPAYSNEYIGKFLEKHDLPATYMEFGPLVDTVVNHMTEEKVIGWFQGRMEFGPRALGSRSILGDARSPNIQKKMNLKIKYRESFRPFAPSVLEEKISDWFEIDRPSPYMLLVADVKKDKQIAMTDAQHRLWGIDKLNVVRSEIPAVTHVDYSARIQSVSKKTNERYHALIDALDKKTGCPVIVNTSFNVRGEPIVQSPLDAYRCFMRTEMDVLVLGNYILYKENQPKFHDTIDWRQEYELD
ncbi:carbamoyltransferase [bacterium]|nr:carbamoyltransferase [bacterium]